MVQCHQKRLIIPNFNFIQESLGDNMLHEQIGSFVYLQTRDSDYVIHFMKAVINSMVCSRALMTPVTALLRGHMELITIYSIASAFYCSHERLTSVNGFVPLLILSM